MQKLMLVTDERSLTAVNEVLSQEEFEISNIIADGSGRWVVVLDDSLSMFDDGDFDYEEDDEDELN